MDLANLLQQRFVLAGTLAFWPRAPSVIAADGQIQGGAHHPDRPHFAMLIDEPELHREADPKMSAAFFRMSRSIRSRSFSRRRRATSETRSDGDGAGACVMGRLAVPVACAENCFTQRRNTVSCNPSSVATFSTDRVGWELHKYGNLQQSKRELASSAGTRHNTNAERVRFL